MKFEFVAILTASVLTSSGLSQEISASWSFLYGSSGSPVAKYPSGYGVYNSNNTPGVRASHKAIFYNNQIYSFHGQPSPANDVWAFNITSKTWTWLAGNSLSTTPSFGSLGVFSVSNTPGYRDGFGGDIYRARNEYILFGGYSGLFIRGDLWSFNLISNVWTWVNGQSSAIDERPVYNTLGNSTSSTIPGGRQLCQCAVYPKTGEFLLFGGWNGQYLADMWAFNFNNSRWTWISGSSVGSSVGSVGQKGEWSAAYYPAARFATVDLVLIPQSNILYIFGGSTQRGPVNDLWGFKRDTLEWSWISGNSTANAVGVYGTMGYSSQNNYPGARVSHTMIYHDKLNLLILSGGYGYVSTRTSSYLADMWAFDVTFSEWAWISGSSVGDWPRTNSSWGSVIASAMFTDVNTSSIYMFGGYGYISAGNYDCWDTIARIDIGSSFLSYAHQTTPSTSMATNMSSRNMTQIRESNTSLPTSSGVAPASRDLLSLKNVLLIFLLLTVQVLICCAAYRFLRTRKRIINQSQRRDGMSETVSSFQTASDTQLSTSGTYTLATSTMGIYLPGELRVDAVQSYRVSSELARGGGGSVWLAAAIEPALNEFGDTVIVKIPNAKQMNERAIALFHQEIALMNAFKKSQNIATLLGYSENPYSIILKYYSHGSLSKWINSGGRTLFQAHAFMKDISHGIALLHFNGVVHCDLKPDNVLIEYGWRLFAVISDFGISRIVKDTLLKVGAYEVQIIKGASVAYAAPEALLELRGVKTARKSPDEIMARDIYAIGVFVSTLISGNDTWK